MNNQMAEMYELRFAFPNGYSLRLEEAKDALMIFVFLVFVSVCTDIGQRKTSLSIKGKFGCDKWEAIRLLGSTLADDRLLRNNWGGANVLLGRQVY